MVRQVLPTRLATLSMAATAIALLTSCSTLDPAVRVALPPAPTTVAATVAYVQVGRRLDGTLRFVSCAADCPGPTPKTPIDVEQMLAAREAAQQHVAQAKADAAGPAASPGQPAAVAASILAGRSQEAPKTPVIVFAAARSSAPNEPPETVVNVLFLDNTAELGPSGRRQVLFAVHEAPDGSLLRVMGRTDARADSESARSLAKARAEAVRASLRRSGVSDDRINLSYLGAGGWFNGRNGTAQERAANRRAIIAINPPALAQPSLEAGQDGAGEDGTRIALALVR